MARLTALFASLLILACASAQTKLLRFPDIHGDRLVFVYAGDLWASPTSGGTATRLTAHPGLEIFPKFSPDGSQIAFTGQYDGDEQVYVILATGGAPKQLTFYPARGPLAPRWGYDHQVYGWTGDGASILFRSTREYWGQKDGRLYTVSTQGGLPAPLPMPVAGAGDLSPDGKSVLYSPLWRDFRAWKRYQGGWAQDLYVFHLDTNETTRVTDHPRSDRDPMWLSDAAYYASDRDGTLNIYRYDVRTKKTKQVTNSSKWDVRWPSSDGARRIVYESNGELEILDVRNGKTTPVEIRVPDDGIHKRPARVSAAKQITDYELSPKGERALFTARGDIFTAPIEKGPTRNLTNSSGANDKWARWSPDGKKIAFVSDMSGEDELYLVDQDGAGEPERLTTDGAVMRYAPAWSPGGKRVAISDKDGKLYVIDLETKQSQEIADDSYGQLRDFAWSPHGGHLAFAMNVSERSRALFIWSASDGDTRQVTAEMFDEWNPAWDPAGDYLFFLSDREFAPQISNTEWNFATDRQTGVFALALRKDVKHPFPPESDEVSVEEDDDKDEDSEEKDKDKDEDEDKQPIEIEFGGLGQRVARAPIEADNLSGLSAVEGNLIYVRGRPFYYGRQADGKAAMQIFSLKDRKAETLVEPGGSYALSADGNKILLRDSGDYARYDVKADAKETKKSVSTKGLMVDRDPSAEWRQIFEEVWRRYRDFFYVKNLHGYDWEGLRGQYLPWLDHVAHRSDLNYVIGEMIAELNVGHAYIEGGEWETPERPKAALPGAEFELDPAAGRYRLAGILTGQNEEEIYRAPLSEIGVNASEGDYVLAIDGDELTAADNPYRLLQNKADRPVELTLNSQPAFDGSRTVEFKPITDESNLRYLNWVEGNRKKVDEATDGRIGYLHVPDMSSSGIREFIKWYFPQIRKEGLVIDVRGNGGGNVSQMLIERLRRTVLGTRFSRTNDHVFTYPTDAYHGHLVCLISENSASDGDIFPARFREAGLGPLIGKRTWGGVIGITNRGNLVDGGVVRVPEFATNSITGDWIIEGYGVDPDIEVDNDAESVIAGGDPQLERGIEEILKMLREDPKLFPERPADPVRTR